MREEVTDADEEEENKLNTEQNELEEDDEVFYTSTKCDTGEGTLSSSSSTNSIGVEKVDKDDDEDEMEEDVEEVEGEDWEKDSAGAGKTRTNIGERKDEEEQEKVEEESDVGEEGDEADGGSDEAERVNGGEIEKVDGERSAEYQGLFGGTFAEASHAASKLPPAPVPIDAGNAAQEVVLTDLTYDQKKWAGIRPLDMLKSWSARKLSKCKSVKIVRLGSAVGGPGLAVALQMRFIPPRPDLVIWTDKRAEPSFTGDGGKVKASSQADKQKSESSKRITIFARTVVEAENWVATRAMFLLDPSNRALENRFPPVFRKECRKWRQEMEQEQQLAAKDKLLEDEEQVHAPRRVFIDQMLADLKATCARGSTTSRGAGLADSPSRLTRGGRTTSKIQAPQPRRLGGRTALLEARQEFEQRIRSADYLHMLKGRQELPVYGFRQELLTLVDQQDVVVVSGETGSGKSTQVPQFMIESGLHPTSVASASGKDSARRSSESDFGVNIIVTQPRRISVVSLASRVSEELGEAGPGSRGSLVGYRIRLDSKRAPTCRLLYCTTGVLLRMMQGDAERAEAQKQKQDDTTEETEQPLQGITHIILDEVHERALESDFLLLLLRRLQAQQRRDAERKGMPARAGFKLILMSATIEAEKIRGYFPHCAALAIPGRLFPVDVKYAEEISDLINFERGPADNQHYGGAYIGDNDGRDVVGEVWDYAVDMELIIALLEWLHKQAYDEGCFTGDAIPGAILIFLPGLDTIKKLWDDLLNSEVFGNRQMYKIFALHSALSNTQHQADVFEWSPPGQRKIVLATNIAETGVTIPDVVFVVDSGRHKEISYDPASRMSRLTERFCSQANAKQRAGRAGRVRPGFCFRIYSRRRFEALDPYPTPEMERSPLVELCLHVLSLPMQHDPVAFLAEALSPPPSKAVHQAVERLERVGAVIPMSAEDTEELAEERALEGDLKKNQEKSETSWEPKDSAGGTSWEEEETELSKNEPQTWYRLTSLGQHLARMPVDVGVGRMLIYAVVMRCLNPVLVVAAALSASRSIFLNPLDAREQARKAQSAFAASAGLSDQLTVYAAYEQWQKALAQKRTGLGPGGPAFCRDRFLHEPTLRLIHRLKLDLLRVLSTAGFVRDRTPAAAEGLNLFSQHKEVVKAVIAAGLYPNVFSITHLKNRKDKEVARNLTGSALIAARKATQQVQIAEGALRRPVSVHPASFFRQVENHAISFNSKQGTFIQTLYYGVYHTKVKTSRAFLRDVTLISPHPLLLFGGTSGGIQVHHTHGLITVDNWMHLNCAPRLGVLLLLLRDSLNDLLQDIFRTPNMDFAADAAHLPLIHAIAQLLSS
eukprot:gb/GEZN01000465.1/.p1 GENE.gb/GEZN01000465.1/~~gb/GEZN01000465.1/.p1  ORF type:complete len:1432 (+),score=321.51 gb/GEZN01000465.1/:281-4297(+)